MPRRSRAELEPLVKLWDRAQAALRAPGLGGADGDRVCEEVIEGSGLPAVLRYALAVDGRLFGLAISLEAEARTEFAADPALWREVAPSACPDLPSEAFVRTVPLGRPSWAAVPSGDRDRFVRTVPVERPSWAAPVGVAGRQLP